MRQIRGTRDYVEMQLAVLTLFKPENPQQHKQHDTQRAVLEWFLARASHYDQVDWSASHRLARRFRTRRKECYANCMRIRNRHPEYQYVEGWAIHLIPVEHAWLVGPDGRVVDPTWCLQEPLTPPSGTSDYLGVVIPHPSPEITFEPRWVDVYRAEKGGETT